MTTLGDLLHALVDCSAVLERAHRIAVASDHPYIAQLLRQAAWKINAAIATLRHVEETGAAS